MVKPGIENMNPDHSSIKTRRPKSREVSSRFLSPPATSQEELPILKSRSSTASATLTAASDTRKQNHKGILWPSTSSPRTDTLADQIGKERHVEVAAKLATLGRQKSCTEFSRFDNDNNSHSSKISRESPGHHKGVFGGSMRYTGKLFSKKSSSKKNSYDDSPSSADDILPRRSLVVSSDSDFSGSYLNSPIQPKKVGSEVPIPSRSMSFDRAPKKKKEPKLKRASSMMTVFGSTTSKWAMSPGRSGSPPMTVENMGVTPMSFSSMKPPTSPSKKNSAKGVGSFLSKGLNLIKGKDKTGIYSPSPSPLGPGMVDYIHQLRMNHNRIVQWRYANAKANNVNTIIADQATNDLIAVRDSITKLQHSVVQKKIQLEKQKLQMKLYYVLRSQIESLKAWGDFERQHTTALSMTKDSLHSVICSVPLVEGAKMDPHSCLFALRHASDLTTSIKSMLCKNTPEVENTSIVCSELAEIVLEEKALLQEFSELFEIVSTLEDEERSLTCSVIQMKAYQQQEEIVT